MTPLTLFGAMAVTAMLVFYALEEQAPVFVLLFAGACAASSVYGFVQGAWPFGLVEAVWTAVAVRRWRGRARIDPAIESQAIACDMSALAPDERRRYDLLRARISAAVSETTATLTTLRLRVDDSMSLPEIAEWVALEHRCCPFLTIAVALRPDGTRRVELGGNPAIKEFVRGEFAALVR